MMGEGEGDRLREREREKEHDERGVAWVRRGKRGGLQGEFGISEQDSESKALALPGGPALPQ